MNKTTSIFIIAVLMVCFLAYMDTQGLQMVNILGGYGSSTYSSIEGHYMRFFWTFSYMIGIAIGITYYLVTRKRNEAIGIFLSYAIMIWTGLEDVVYYFLLKMPIDKVLPWLDGKPLLMLVTKVLGNTTVTKGALLVGSLLGIILAYNTAYYFKIKKPLGGS